MTRGGAGRGQGRKKSIPDGILRVVIGDRCVQIRQEHSETEAFQKLNEAWGDSLAQVRAEVQAERERRYKLVISWWEAGRVKDARRAQKEFQKWEAQAVEKLRRAFKAARGRKPTATSLDRYRPKPLTRKQIYAIVAEEFQVSISQVRICWIERNKVLGKPEV